MPYIRDILNKIKWTKNLHNVKIWYIHRGSLNNIKVIPGAEIIDIGRSFLQLTTVNIPYHRIIKIMYDEKTIFNRSRINSKHKQL